LFVSGCKDAKISGRTVEVKLFGISAENIVQSFHISLLIILAFTASIVQKGVTNEAIG